MITEPGLRAQMVVALAMNARRGSELGRLSIDIADQAARILAPFVLGRHDPASHLLRAPDVPSDRC